MTTTTHYTLADIARLLNTTHSRILYFVRKGIVYDAPRLGNYRAYCPDDVELFRVALEQHPARPKRKAVNV